MRRVFVLLALAGCDDLRDFSGDAPPLVSIDVAIDGALPSGVIAPRVALMWGTEWLTEPLCILPPDSAEAAAAIAAGCRDAFGFVPARVGANADVVPGAPTTISLAQLPAADVMVGDVTSRVAYASFVLYDDRDASGTLELSRAHRLGGRDRGPPMEDAPDSRDVVYAASFLTMTAPDQRLAFREGAFTTTAFYPRAGCGDPLPAFSILAAGGFTADAAIAATLAGTLPTEDPATCAQLAPDDPAATVTLHVRAPDDVREVACEERATDSSIRFREPPIDQPDLTGRTTACTKLAAFGDVPADQQQTQLVVSGRAGECKGLTHYVLKGCREDALCALPDWDISATPPAWWPCH